MKTDVIDANNVKRVGSSASSFSLPLLINHRNKYRVGTLTFIFAAMIYLISNHFPIFEPRLLPMTSWDNAIPFVPWTVWIYVSEYMFFVVIYLLCRDEVNLNKYVYAVVAIQVVSVLIFILWPTTFPRHLYPLPEGLDAATYWIFSSLREGDSPNNCAPSLHVSSVLLCSFLFFNEQRKKLPFFLIWGSLISLSTLTTKQHYIVDVVSGLLMAILFHWLFYRKLTYKKVAPTFLSSNVSQ